VNIYHYCEFTKHISKIAFDSSWKRALPRCGFSRSPTSYLLPRPRDPIGRSRRFDRLRQNLPTWKFKLVCASTWQIRFKLDPELA